VVVPEISIQKKFVETIKAYRKKINSLVQINEVAITARDRLLSRLMSGKLDVERLNIRFPKSFEEEDAGEKEKEHVS